MRSLRSKWNQPDFDRFRVMKDVPNVLSLQFIQK